MRHNLYAYVGIQKHSIYILHHIKRANPLLD